MGQRGQRGHDGWRRRPTEGEWEQHRDGRRGDGPEGWERGWDRGWDRGRGGSRRGRQGPPPWIGGLFGAAQGGPGGDPRRGPRVRRGDVRSAILDVLRHQPMNGYQIISQIAERSDGAWRPSPGSVYPTISQLEDEGLVTTDESAGRRTLRLTEAGEAYVAERADDLAAVWRPFERDLGDGEDEVSRLKPEIVALMNAVWQIVTTGTEQQHAEAIDLLVETRRKLYGLLAEGDVE
ncbi:MAG: PadR family transcriptional regulator [Nocardioides sp.]|uniref:PadR family transcriptional regulator n=1 Tax=Nocardioides sp. TaxID=35761 RepID=UPI0039E2D308